MVNTKLFESSSPTQLINLLGCAKALREEATLVFDDEGIKIIEMDASHVAMLMLSLPRDFFDEYNDWKGSISINLAEVLKVLGKINKDDELFASFDPEMSKLTFTLKGYKHLTRNKTIPTLEPIEDEDVPMPKIFFKTKTRLITSALEYAVRDISNVSAHIKFRVDPSVFEISAISDLASETTPFTKGSDNVIDHRTEESECYEATFTNSYLTTMLKEFNKVSKAVTVELDTDMPLHIDVELPKGKLDFYLAPCCGV